MEVKGQSSLVNEWGLEYQILSRLPLKRKKKKKNPISQLADIHGVLYLMSPALQICLLNLDLFTSSTPSQIDIYLFALNHKGTDQMNAILCQTFYC